MAFPDDALPVESRCEICGVKLGDETVIQEFADGSLARLCPECAAGAALGERHHSAPRRDSLWPDKQGGSIWPDDQGVGPDSQPADNDPLERTRELLMPVGDLIALQSEMQSALERLAGSLERFAAEYITEAQSKTAAESRLRMLERELDLTRSRLQEAELSLTSAAAAASASDQILDAAAVPPAAEPAPLEPTPLWPPTELGSTVDALMPLPGEEVPLYPGASASPDELLSPDLLSSSEAAEAPEVFESPEAPEGPEALASPLAFEPAETRADSPPTEPVTVSAGTAGGPAPAGEGDDSSTFRIDEVQAAQRFYNESPFTSRIRDVHRSLGKPRANLTKVPGGEPRAIVTIAWDIVWYQYLVYLRRDLPSSYERVVLHREGMDLDELAYYFKEKNAVVNDGGRLDASELEVRLLSDPSALITEMTAEERRLLEDATEEIWDQRAAPEFKWDD